MSKFHVREALNRNGFDSLLLLTNSEPPLTPVSEIEKIASKLQISRILIDQILHSGNTDERYISLEIVDGKVNSSSICFFKVSKGDIIREESRKILCDNNLIEFSILSNIQKKMLKKGIPI
ncbi:hypothetical protein J28TS4_40250 [Paenibacillus lautus]|uniref:type II toxin-antitoxin system RnlB family antitoxin n=1 Tax=Paenibacillus lautus TaxID=1401 RepID=UPI001B0AC6CF|nr:type II toxin-antitoxin system RnlB family antitoxin [Paenibacillus lautus]GIP05618.1 hypothetical protein J28TS4_40250 [Paenibacillus lautus]